MKKFCLWPRRERSNSGRRLGGGLLSLGGLVFGAIFLLASAVADLTIVAPPVSEFEVRAATAEDIRWARGGHAVIYMRHGATDPRFPDQVPVDLNDCSAQRPLSDAGRAQLREIAAGFAQLQLPHTPAHTSPFCRAVESARIVFGDQYEVDLELRYTAAMPEVEKAPAVARTRWHLSRPLETPGFNRLVVAHGPNIADLIDYLPPEGTLILFRPLGDSFEYVASIEPKHWAALLQELAAE